VLLILKLKSNGKGPFTDSPEEAAPTENFGGGLIYILSGAFLGWFFCFFLVFGGGGLVWRWVWCFRFFFCLLCGWDFGLFLRGGRRRQGGTSLVYGRPDFRQQWRAEKERRNGGNAGGYNKPWGVSPEGRREKKNKGIAD